MRGVPPSRKTAGLATAPESRANAARTSDKGAEPVWHRSCGDDPSRITWLAKVGRGRVAAQSCGRCRTVGGRRFGTPNQRPRVWAKRPPGPALRAFTRGVRQPAHRGTKSEVCGNRLIGEPNRRAPSPVPILFSWAARSWPVSCPECPSVLPGWRAPRDRPGREC